VRSNSGFRLQPGARTLARRLKAAGWRTGAAVSSFVLARPTGIAQGFDFYEDAVEGAAPEAFNAPQRDGAVATDALARWIEAQGAARFFAFLHLYEPHSPYAPPERHRGLKQPYDGEVAYADELVGRLIDRLDSRGLLDPAIVVVTSDHGEGLGDHGEDEHGVFLYRSTLRVPLLIKLPGDRLAGRRIGGTASQVDVAATLLDLVGLPAPDMDGASLRHALVGAAPARLVYSETLYPRYTFGWSDLRAAADDRFRYIRAPRPELYDIRRDPDERTNLAGSAAGAVSSMEAWLARAASGDVPRPERLSNEAAERLRALGYLAGSDVPAETATLQDPKDRIATYQALKRALDLHRARRDADSVPAFRAVLRDNPRMPEVWDMLGEALLRSGRPEEAVAALEAGLRIDPKRPSLHLSLMRAHLDQGRVDRAAFHAAAAAGNRPGAGAELLSQALVRRGRLDRAAAYARRSLAQNEHAVMARYVLGVVEQKAGRYERALAEFRRALATRPPGAVVPGLNAKIGDCLERLGRDADAEAEFRSEIDVNPPGTDARVALARVLRRRGEAAEARAVLDEWLLVVPDVTAEVYSTLVEMYRRIEDAASAAEWASIAHEQFPTDPRFGGAPRDAEEGKQNGK
jgi:tetratricopeptide (TPR) repeat protein